MPVTMDEITSYMLQQIEVELAKTMDEIAHPVSEELHTMLAYHLGWETRLGNKSSSGKRIRPLLLLLTTAAAGGGWVSALPAAAAVELIHNFSLIHDDIQDNSPLRRGRPTVWKIWGIPQAINAGDSMYSLAFQAMLRLETTCTNKVALRATNTLLNTCLRLTEGQYLDIAFESRPEIKLDDYWGMIGRKTAALLSACAQIGALVAAIDETKISSYQTFGFELGLAFQVQDDLLGIWGQAALTGKSTDSDLVSGKKSLPVIYGLTKEAKFSHRWRRGQISPEEVKALASQLENEGALEYGKREVVKHTQNALKALEDAAPLIPYGDILKSIAMKLLDRSG
jgi:geranylgeranyl diphosphate synthase type I